MSPGLLRPLLISLLAAFIIGISCSEDDEIIPSSLPEEILLSGTDVSDSLSINFSVSTLKETSYLDFHSSQDAALLIIESDVPWTASTDDNWLAMAAWSGDAGTTGVLAGAAANKTAPRNGRIDISAGGKSQVINVHQSGAPVINIAVDGVTFKMVLVEGGSFTFGTSEIPGVGPAYEVTLSDYYICETEVTNGLWNAVMGSLPYDLVDDYAGHTEYDKPDHPLTAATWDAVVSDFLPALATLTDLNFRLPTEAEWEYAAMGGQQTNGYVYAGGNDLDKVGWYDWNSKNEKHPVKQKLPNELGLYDMSGNVGEWCSDWYASYYNTEQTVDPGGPAEGTERVVRGGDYTSSVQFTVGFCAVKNRSYLIPSCVRGCWGNTGHPNEPDCFFCMPVGFRFVMPL